MQPSPTVIALIRFCRKELASLGERLGLLNKTIEQYAESAYAAEERHRHNEESGESKRRVISFDDQSKREDRENKNREHSTQNSIKWATWLAVIAASLYSFVAYRQYRELINATGATRDAVHEARQSRLLSQQEFRATVEQVHLDQRAWVGITQLGMIPSGPIKAGDEVFFQMVAQNTGKTPALKTKPYIHWSILHPGDPLVAPAGPKPLQSVATFFPNSPLALNTQKMKFGDTEIPRLVSGSDVFKVWGEIQYEDIFQGRHWTHFCFYLGTDLTGLNACDKYNETDDLRQKKPN